MRTPLRLISTDFDGTVFSEFERPPVPPQLEELLGRLQAQGVKWAINTGRDLSSLMEALGRSHLRVRPDYLVVVEREIFFRAGPCYRALRPWNTECHAAHAVVFEQVRADLPRLQAWITERFQATVYEDDYSPLCLIADSNGSCDQIQLFLEEYCRSVPGLTVVRNDIYARFSHQGFSKGTALGEIARQVGAGPAETLAAGDHLNDLPMLDPRYARWLVAPANAVPSVKQQVLEHGGCVTDQPAGHGLAQAIEAILERAAKLG